MKGLYRYNSYISINGKQRHSCYGGLSGNQLRYGEIPENRTQELDFTSMRSACKDILNKRTSCWGYRETLFTHKPRLVVYEFNGNTVYPYDKIKTFTYIQEYKPLDISRWTASELIKELPATEWADWLKDNGLSVCPMK